MEGNLLSDIFEINLCSFQYSKINNMPYPIVREISVFFFLYMKALQFRCPVNILSLKVIISVRNNNN